MSIGDWTKNDQLMKAYQEMQNAQLTTTGTTWTTNATSLGQIGSAGLHASTPTYGSSTMQPANGWKVVTWARPVDVETPVEVRVRPIIGFVQQPYSTELTYVWADGASVRQGEKGAGVSRVLTLVGPDEADALEAWQAEAQALYEAEVVEEAAERLAPTKPTDEDLKQAWATGYAKIVQAQAPSTLTNRMFGGVPVTTSTNVPAGTLTFLPSATTTLTITEK